MNKAGGKCRDIIFKSNKNQKVMCVHSREAREYAKVIEEDPRVLTYEINVQLDMKKYVYVNPIDIRKEYFEISWTTDFLLHYVDGSVGIREMVIKSKLSKRSEIEKLEFSRRYWSASDVLDWKIVIVDKKEG
jgi:hypothetical protein